MDDYRLSQEDVNVIKSALKAHIKQCKEFITLNNRTKTFTIEERTKVYKKIALMGNLLEEL